MTKTPLNDAPEQGIMQINYDNALLYWDELLTLQTEIFSETELQSLHSLEEWNYSEHILDAGCGNGAYLDTIAKSFPFKKYTGIDIVEELIEIAQNSFSNHQVEFMQKDFFQLAEKGSYDFIFMRFFLQHLTETKQLFNHASKLLKNDGCLVIVEPKPDLLAMHPETPLFNGFLNRIEEYNSAINSNRVNLNKLNETLQKLSDWKVLSSNITTITASNEKQKKLFYRMFQLWILLYESSEFIRYQYHELRSELRSWFLDKNSTTNVAIGIYIMQKAV